MTTSSAPLTHFSLFSGIGGLDLAAEWAGFQTVGQVEKGDYANKILKKHWPDVPRWEDIKDVTIHTVREAGVEHAPTVLSGGFPCQPFSCAGQRKGAEDDRYLWPEMLRVVQELRPAWVIGENVAGLVSLALDDVCADLEREGYACRPLVFPAAGVGAPHMRDRVFVVAHSVGVASGSSDQATRSLGMHLAARDYALCGGIRQFAGEPSEDVAGPYGERCKERDPTPRGGEAGSPPWRADPFGGLWLSEPAVGRVVARLPAGVDELGLDRHDYGVPYARNRAARLRCLGNAVVPQQAYPIFAAIAAIEMGVVV